MTLRACIPTGRSLRRLLGGAGLLVAGAAAASDPLPGRLFHTPAERAALDGTVRPARSLARPRAAPAAPAAQPGLRGFVLRSDGQDSYWVERRPAPSPPPPLRQ